MKYNTLYNELKAIMAKNFDDYCAEEYDARYDAAEYNKHVAAFKAGEYDGVFVENINDYNMMVAWICLYDNGSEPFKNWQQRYNVV